MRKTWVNRTMTFLGVAALTCAFMAPAALAAATPTVKVAVRGSFNATLKTSDFLNVYLAGPDDEHNYSPNLDLAGAGPFMGYISVYFNRDLKPGTYPIRSVETNGKPTAFELNCSMLMNGGDSSACVDYGFQVKGTLKLTHTGSVYSGTFDVSARDKSGKHHVHVTGSFADLLPKKH